MPRPSTSLSTLRPDLAAGVEEFNLANDRAGFIGLKVLPVFEAAQSAGTFGRIPLKQLLQRRTTERSARAGYSRGDWTFEPDSYATQERGAEEPIDENDVANYKNYFDVEQICAQRAYDAVLREQEIRIADLLFNATTFTPTAVTNEWDDADNAAPIDDVDAAVQRVWESTGLWPNALIINRLVFRNLRKCGQILERIASLGAGGSTLASDVTAAQIAAACDLKYVHIAGSPYDTANEGQTPVLAPIWSNEYAMVARIAETNDLREPCLGRTIHWADDGSVVGGVFESYREEAIRSDVIRVRHQVGEKLIYPEAGELLSNITT